MKKVMKLLVKILGGVVGLVAALVIFLLLVPTYTENVKIDFTRYLFQPNQEVAGQQAGSETFFGVPGSARLIVSRSGEALDSAITLNGETVVASGNSAGATEFEVPVELMENNTISVQLNGAPDDSISVRVKQLADLELHVQSRIHFNTNVSDFEKSHEFYKKIGFETLSGFPDTNTLGMAEAIGIETPTTYDGSQGDFAGGYLLHGKLVGIGGLSGGVIDLIEFTIPRNDDPPYARINHLGMAKATMETTNIAADYDYMTGLGIEFLAAPIVRADGAKFAIFKDPDGVFYELLEVEGEDQKTETTHIFKVSHLTINVSDFERSLAWYQMMGYDLTKALPSTDSINVANAMGFDEVFRRKAAILTHRSDGSTVELVQWITPYDPERAYEIPVNHIGMHRTAFLSADIEADVAALREQGVVFLSEITPCCTGTDSSTSIIAFYDPDGTIVELADAGIMSKVFTVIGWFSD